MGFGAKGRKGVVSRVLTDSGPTHLDVNSESRLEVGAHADVGSAKQPLYLGFWKL